MPDDNRKRLRNARSISKKLYETDRGPLIVVDQIQNIEEQIPKNLDLPSKYVPYLLKYNNFFLVKYGFPHLTK